MKTLQTTPANRRNFKLFLALAAISTFAIVSCVTVNVNFPESAVQKASDDYVRDLYNTKGQSHPATPKSSATPAANSAFLIPNQILNLVYHSAVAADAPTFNMSSPKLDSIKEKMRAIVPDILIQKKAGILGETNDGKVVIHDASKVKPLLKQKIEDLVTEDAKLRDSLYAEVMSSNHLPSNSLPSVKKSFAHSFQAESPSGTWVQDAAGGWSQKP